MKTLQLLLVSIMALFAHTQTCAQDTVRYAGMREFIDDVTGVFKTNHPGLTFFKYHLISTDGNIYDWYKGKNDGTDSINSFLYYANAVKDLELSNFNPDDTSVSFDKMCTSGFKHMGKGKTPLSLSFVEYEDFKDSTLYLNLIGWSSNKFTETTLNGYYPFVKKRFFMASALNEIIKMPNFNFYLDDELIFSNIRNKMDSIFIDFGDNGGFRHINKGESYAISYPNEGPKNCIVKLKTDQGYNYSTFIIYDSTQTGSGIASAAARAASAFAPTIGPININTAGANGQYAVWLSDCNTTGQIRKPYIICAPFNPANGKQLVPFQFSPSVVQLAGNTITLPFTLGFRGTWYETFNGFFSKDFSPGNTTGDDNGTRYLDRLREEGYDIVIMMNSDGVDYIDKTASLLEVCIQAVNSAKAANGSFENVVSGYSAGGIAARLCLAKMESQYRQGLIPHHHTRLFLNFDGEAQGVNVPLGMQCFIDFQANPNNSLPFFWGGINFLQVLADGIDRQVANIFQGFNTAPAASELNCFNSSNAGGVSPNRTALLLQLASITGNNLYGYPEYMRRVSVSQGASQGTPISYGAAEIFDSELVMSPLGTTHTETDCYGTYTVYYPTVSKKTTARWWASNNSQNIFDGRVYFNENWTWMKRDCNNYNPWGNACLCVGPYMFSGAWAVVGDQHIAKPGSPANFDESPASVVATQNELHRGSAYQHYSSVGGTSSHDPTMHSFAPVSSVLDLRNPSTGQNQPFTASAVGLGLMNVRSSSSGLVQHPDKRFGFPHLAYPSNHYQVTPYDGVYAVGTNNLDLNNNTKPDNQCHVEDVQAPVADYLSQTEVAPEEMFLSNQTIGGTASAWSGYLGGYVAEFEARNKIIIGRTLDGFASIYDFSNTQPYLTAGGDLKVAVNTKAIIHAGQSVELYPGTEIPQGAEAALYIDFFPNGSCTANVLQRSAPPRGFETVPLNTSSLPTEETKFVESKGIKIYPNPANNELNVVYSNTGTSSMAEVYDLSGKLLLRQVLQNNAAEKIDLNSISNGIYLLRISDTNFKLIVNK